MDGADDERADRAADRGEHQADAPEPRPGWTGPQRSERYQAMPAVTRLPGRLWRSLPLAGRLLLVALPLAAIALALVLAPGINESKEERAQAESERVERNRAARIERLRAEQRPRFTSGAPAPNSVAGRRRLVAAAAADVQADARGRARRGELEGPVRDTVCEGYPRTEDRRGADRDLGRSRGRYACLAVTASFGGSGGEQVSPYAASEAGSIGHPYRVMIDFETGRIGYCKVSGRAGEGGLRAETPVTVPRACGGG